MKRKKLTILLSIFIFLLVGNIVYAQNIISIKLQGNYNEENESMYMEWVYGPHNADVAVGGGNLTSKELSEYNSIHENLLSGCVCLPWAGECGDGYGTAEIPSPFSAYGYPNQCYGGGGDS